MNVTPAQIANANKAGVEMMLGITNTQFAAFERLSALNFNATRAAIESSVTQSKALLGAKDVQELVSMNSTAAKPNIENAIAYSRGIYELVTQTRGEITNLIESQATEFNKSMVGFLDEVSKTAGSDVAVAAVKSALGTANLAYDSIAKLAKQATEIAESSFTAATDTAKHASRRLD